MGYSNMELARDYDFFSFLELERQEMEAEERERREMEAEERELNESDDSEHNTGISMIKGG